MLRRSWETKRKLILESNKRILGEGVESPTKEHFDVAVDFCTDIEKWWSESDNLILYADRDSEYAKFFCPYQYTWDDDEEAAARAYKTKVMYDLNKEVGVDNYYYLSLSLHFATSISGSTLKYFVIPSGSNTNSIGSTF